MKANNGIFSDFINSSLINYEIYKLNSLKTIKCKLSRKNFRFLYYFLIRLRKNDKDLFIANSTENDDIIIKLGKKIPYISFADYLRQEYKTPTQSTINNPLKKDIPVNVFYLSDYRGK